MPKEYGAEVTEKIATMRALDYSKKKIAETLDISRHTVTSHLKDLRKEYQHSDDPEDIINVEIYPNSGIFPLGAAGFTGSFNNEEDDNEELEEIKEEMEEQNEKIEKLLHQIRRTDTKLQEIRHKVPKEEEENNLTLTSATKNKHQSK
jgi:predicted transcriptional regulator